MDESKTGPAKRAAGKEGQGHNVRLREIKAERDQITKTITEAKARRGQLDAERATLRPDTPKAK